MKLTITEGTFINTFKSYGRADQFSREALGLLFDYYEELDPEMELDVIAICCDWAEYETIEEIKRDYNAESIEELEQEATVLANDRENGPWVVANH